MNRSLKLSILVALTLSSAQALALGLGQIRVKSTLNKPLVAEIPLRVDYPGEADKLEVSLASAKQFERVGLDRMSLSVQLHFKVTTNAAGQKVIRVTSEQPVRESYLDFLVKVDWPRGQLLREYTILLDPPVMVTPTRLQGAVAPAVPAPAPKPQARPSAPTPAPAPAKPRTKPVASTGKTVPVPRKPAVKPTVAPAPRKPAPAPSPAPVSTQGGNYGPVAHGQTLWGIARKMRSSDISVNQMMLALKSTNPDAFYKNNINALKSGAVLRIPTHEQVMATNKAAATAEVLRQDHAWQAVAPSRPTMVAKAGHAASGQPSPRASASRTGAGHAAGSGGDHLKLVPPSEGGNSTGARAGSAHGSNKVVVEKLQQDVARAKEALSSAKQQTADLQARLKSLKDIQNKNDRLMSLKNAEIAELQNKLAESGKPAAGASAMAPAMSGSVAQAASATRPAAASTAAKTAASGVAGASTAAATPVVAKTAATKPAATVRPHARRPGEPWYATLWAKVAAALVLLIGLIGLFLRGRGKNKPARSGRSSSLADQFGSSPLGDAPSVEGLDEELDELLHQLAEHPDDIDTHLELVSLYYARRDVEGFESAAEAMHAHISDPEQPEWRDVMTMGEELAPDYPLFADAGQAYEPEVDEEPDAGVYEADHEPEGADADATAHAAAPDASEAHEEAAGERSATEYSYDFDLSPTASSAPTEAPSEDEFDALPPLTADEAAPESTPEDEAGAASDPLPDLELSTQGTTAPESASETPHDPEAGHDFDLESEGLDLDLGDLDMGGDEPAASEPPQGLGGDAVDTKIDLARAYMDMGDPEGARAMLEEALAEGGDAQRETAQKLLDELD